MYTKLILCSCDAAFVSLRQRGSESGTASPHSMTPIIVLLPTTLFAPFSYSAFVVLQLRVSAGARRHYASFLRGTERLQEIRINLFRPRSQHRSPWSSSPLNSAIN